MKKAKILAVAALGILIAVALVNRSSKSPESVQDILEDVCLESVEVAQVPLIEKTVVQPILQSAPQPSILTSVSDDSALPMEVDRMAQLFNPYPPLLPIVETITYSGRVPWLTGRAAYLGDYAAHYQTSKHFISRSLHGMGKYLSDVVSKGQRFNVLRTDKEIEFHLLLDLSRLKLWVYYFDKGEGERTLLKAYPVCAGRLDQNSRSGSLTPFGTFSLGNEIAVYKPGDMGLYRNEMQEMIKIFGVRWIPLDREIANCTASCKGLGIHGIGWHCDPNGGSQVQDRACIGNYESNGCIRLHTEDIEELFALIVSRPTYIHIVSDFIQAKLPGHEH